MFPIIRATNIFGSKNPSPGNNLRNIKKYFFEPFLNRFKSTVNMPQNSQPNNMFFPIKSVLVRSNLCYQLIKSILRVIFLEMFSLEKNLTPTITFGRTRKDLTTREIPFRLITGYKRTFYIFPNVYLSSKKHILLYNIYSPDTSHYFLLSIIYLLYYKRVCPQTKVPNFILPGQR